MDDDVLSDPAEQLKRMRRLRELSTQCLTSLDTSIRHFMAKFDEQKTDLTSLYQKTQDHQRVSENISAVRVRLQAIIDLLQVHDRLLPHITANIEQTFDNYMNTMEEIKQAQIQLADQNFEDARKADRQLVALQRKGQDEIVKYFEAILLHGRDPLPETTFQLVDGKLEVTNADLRDHIVHPLSDEEFNRLGTMARVLDRMSGTVEHWLKYEEVRGGFLMESLQPIIDRSGKRVVSETPQDALDIATYSRFSHPIHLLAQALN
jgi:cellobiose-specific phosphotransferase system component IIA